MAVLVTAPVTVEVTAPSDSAPAGCGASPVEGAPGWSSQQRSLLPMGWTSPQALPAVPPPPCTAVTAVPREKPRFKENKPSGLERRAVREHQSAMGHVASLPSPLPHHLLPGDAGGNRQHLQK